ncbi:MAG: hypothetical protein KAH56_10430 [Candidatus Krumholzibacteria bacterium]|nr:hypothetical protein [Candidatus Krumholzibacteria bacterium]
MKSLQITILCLIILGAGGVLFAEESAPVRELSPMMTEIMASMETARLEVADLKLRYDAAIDDQAAMEIMREVARVKKESRVEMMRIQLRYARLDGNDELAGKLEEIVAKMTAPPAKGVPIPRSTDQK